MITLILKQAQSAAHCNQPASGVPLRELPFPAALRLTLALLFPALPALQGAERLVADSAQVAAAARAANPGDVIIMRDGIWTNSDLRFEGQGTAEAPITLRAQTPGKVILSGLSRLRLAGQHLVVAGLWFKDGYTPAGEVIAFRTSSPKQARNCRVTNCAITDYSPPARKTASHWLSLYGAHNRVDRCAFVGKQNVGTTLVVWVSGAPNEHQIDRNYFGRRAPLGANGGETIRVGDSASSMNDSGTVVELNLFENCSGEVEIISNKSCENAYRHNTFLNCQGALTLRHGNRCTVAGNFFLGNNTKNTGGVRICGEDHLVYNNYFADLAGTSSRSALTLMNGVPNSPLSGYFQVKEAVVAFNTFVNCRSTLCLGMVGENPPGSILPPHDCVIANNIVQSKKGPLVEEMTKPANLRWQANLFHGAPLGIPRVPGMELADPQLRLSPEGLWRPAKTSPAVGRAVAEFSFVRTDIDGQPRGAKPDIGCDQLSSAPIQYKPLTRDVVGPTWKLAP